MKKVLIGLVVLLIGIGAGWFVFGGKTETPESAMPVPGTTGVTEMVVNEEQSTVTYTDTGYSPKEITVKQGTTVTFVNQSSGGMWTASAIHPTHQLLPGFDQLESVSKGGMYEYTFEKVGTWKYHNHVKATDTGTVVVTE
ncbi:hypothetical protein A3A79_03135 [Candidatus Gottesmanbacteria bacterium RIFCSPLOWO2_01_FULL_43_11b]|uniref:EfeO-type cupredoxin-like domain-containing protein n=1 Tax=Candidatus Gottesmanbacteria bacterium RIFCSPLOWO2_01_FULL_43_11b TaxID=1798392 RepID=A0A1F6AHE3_9BACT|nr:MAG: hypothetical protein A3A79_03135 [Candidatus Gottesmanbacteria bacterium RIFCSPLOWO2_01_FULL_43_11b]